VLLHAHCGAAAPQKTDPKFNGAANESEIDIEWQKTTALRFIMTRIMCKFCCVTFPSQNHHAPITSKSFLNAA
jgi:hypothetical protein